MVDKGGFVKVIEAYIAIGLLLGLLFLVVQTNNVQPDGNRIITSLESNVLESIQMNDSLRLATLSVTDFSLSSNDTGFSSDLKPYATINNPHYNCYLKVCSFSGTCDINLNYNQIYSTSVLITSSLSNYEIRRLKMFCAKNA